MAIAIENAEKPIITALERIKVVVGAKGWSTDADTIAPYIADQRGLFLGDCALLVRPASTAEVSEVVKICAEANIAIVPQGGNTGLVGAGIPDSSAVLVSLGRMNCVRDIDPLDYTITVEAGCILADVQTAALSVDRLFPLSLGAEGTCQIGGNLSTNAGGVNVLRYGNARELVLGLEVVLPDGRIWEGLKRLRKDNTGYDLKQLYIGGEGTLGIITAAVCKLFPNPKDVQTAFVALRDLDAALEVLARARGISGDRVTSFELICHQPLASAVQYIHGIRHPLDSAYDEYALVEFSGASANSGMREAMETMLSDAFEAGEVIDATIAQSDAQRADLWRIREAVVEAQAFEGGSIKNDVSVPVSRVPEFIRQANAALIASMPGIRPVAFGHCGDGNIHYNLAQPIGMDKAAFLKEWGPITKRVYDIVMSLGGSFSAEHGVGQLKLDEMARYKDVLELDMMRKVKDALDPNGTMNPGKML
jgi:FAD/FMN-containing dehydrogenase